MRGRAHTRYRIRTAIGTFMLSVEGRMIRGVDLRPKGAALAAPADLRKTFEAALSGRPLRGWSMVRGGSPLERAVWRQLLRIPYGVTVSYSEVARRAGYPRAVRAVASAIGRNPLPILVPCHRVVSKSGEIGGYAGPIVIKKGLLALERSRSVQGRN